MTTNVTLVKSETDLRSSVIETSKKRPLEGQSPYVVNLGLFYAARRGRAVRRSCTTSLAVGWLRVGVQGLPDIYEQPRASLDMTITRCSGGSRLKFSMENILDDDIRFEQEAVLEKTSKLTSHTHRGRSISLSISTGG